VIGSIIAFYLARQYGQQFVKSMVSEHTYNRYISWLDKGQWFDYFFAFMMFFPVSPDDFLCMLAGLTKMTYKKFIIKAFFLVQQSTLMFSSTPPVIQLLYFDSIVL